MPNTVVEGERSGIRSRHAPAWLVLSVACAGQFMVVLDVSVVNVALPSIRHALGFDAAGLQWVVNAYALTFAGFLMLGGRIADLYGRKRVFIAGLALFSLSSLVGGLAAGPGALIVARAVQGVGAAVLAPATLTILTTTFTDGPARARALATWTAVAAGGGAAGALVGGLLTEYLSWRWILLVNVPIGVIVTVAAIYGLSESREYGARRLDVPGALLITGGVAAIAYGIVQTNLHGWGSGIALLPMAAGGGALAALVAIERRAAAPLVPLRLFRARSVSAGTLIMLLVGMAGFAMWYFLSLYMQNVLGYGALRAGLAFLPHTTMIIIGSKAAPRLMTWLGPRALIVLGAVVTVAGFLLQSRMTVTSSFTTGILLPAAPLCLGMGLMMTPIATLVTAGAAPSEAGLVSGLVNAARTVGGSLGLAILATVAAAGLGPRPDANALTEGYATAFLVSAAIVGAAAVLVAALPRPARVTQG